MLRPKTKQENKTTNKTEVHLSELMTERERLVRSPVVVVAVAVVGGHTYPRTYLATVDFEEGNAFVAVDFVSGRETMVHALAPPASRRARRVRSSVIVLQ